MIGNLLTLVLAAPDFEYNGLVNMAMQLKKNVVADLCTTSFFWLAASIAAIGATIYTAKTCAEIMNGHEFSIWELLKPLAICLLCVNFNLVLSVLDIIPNGISRATAEIVYQDKKSNPTGLADLYRVYQVEHNKLEKKRAAETGSEDAKTESDVQSIVQPFKEVGKSAVSGIEGLLWNKVGEDNTSKNVRLSDVAEDKNLTFWEKVKTFVAAPFGFVCDGLTAALSQTVTRIMDFAFPCIIVVSQIMLAILSFLGPFVLAFSVFPGFGGFKSWCTRYMHTAFWMPVTYILNMIYTMGVQSLSGTVAGAGAGFYATRVAAALIFGLAAFVNIFKVPTLSTYVVDTAINSGLGRTPQVLSRGLMRLMTNGSRVGRALNSLKRVVVGGKPTGGGVV